MLKKLLLLSCIATQSYANIADQEIGYWSLWSDEQGISHQSFCKLDDLTLQNFSVKGDPERVSNHDMKTTRYVFNIMPRHWKGTWHKSPKPQWVTTLSGNWYIESMDGHRVELPAGTISFGYDINAKNTNGKLGHLSGTVGEEPTKILVVQVEDLPKNIQDKRCLAGGTFIR